MDARARLRRPRATTETTRERLAADDALERRLRAMEHAVERADHRTSTLAKLVKCAKDSEDEDREAMRETIERLRKSVECVRREREAVEESREEETRVRGVTREANANATNATADDASVEREAFERRMDARVEKMMVMLEASARSASGGSEVAALREELRLEREARRIETETLAARVDALSRALASAEGKVGRAHAYERVSDARRSCANGAARVRDDGGSRRVADGWNDDDDDGENDDDDEEHDGDENDPKASSTRSNARPELEARRRRLRALYRELQTLSF